MMKWCCTGFQAKYEQRHERGFLVFVRPPDSANVNEPTFYFAFRAVELDQQKTLAVTRKGRLEGCISLAGCMRMRFCPGCGAELARFYQRSWPELVDQRLIDEFLSMHW